MATPSAEPTWRSELNTPAAIPASAAANSDSAVMVLATTPSAIGHAAQRRDGDTTSSGVVGSKAEHQHGRRERERQAQDHHPRGAEAGRRSRRRAGRSGAASSGHGSRTSAVSVGVRPRTSWR